MKQIEIKLLETDTPQRRAAEVLIYDEIGADMFGGGLTAKGFSERLDALGELDTLVVRINSPGGDAFDGSAIYNALVRSKARVEVHIDGLAASAASFIAMAGDEINIAENATVMIHQASGLVYGPADEMEKTATILRKLDDQIAGVYAKRTGRRNETFLKMMQDETWFNAEEAVAARLADKITPNKKAVAHFDQQIMNRISKRPDKIAALLKPEPPPVEVLKVVDAAPVEDEAAKQAALAERLAERNAIAAAIRNQEAA